MTAVRQRWRVEAVGSHLALGSFQVGLAAGSAPVRTQHPHGTHINICLARHLCSACCGQRGGDTQCSAHASVCSPRVLRHGLWGQHCPLGNAWGLRAQGLGTGSNLLGQRTLPLHCCLPPALQALCFLLHIHLGFQEGHVTGAAPRSTSRGLATLSKSTRGENTAQGVGGWKLR